MPIRDTVNNPFTGARVAAGDNNPCCDYWRDPDTRTPSPRLGSRFGGPHTGGMNAVFADGSVRTVSWSVSQPIFARLCDRRDGLPIDASQME